VAAAAVWLVLERPARQVPEQQVLELAQQVLEQRSR
jgi:hypothetical protein